MLKDRYFHCGSGMNSNSPLKFHIDTPNDVMFANQSYIFQPATHRFWYLFVQFQLVFSVVFALYLANLSQDVDDVEMFERRINAMLTIGIKKEDLTQVPPKF